MRRKNDRFGIKAYRRQVARQRFINETLPFAIMGVISALALAAFVAASTGVI